MGVEYEAKLPGKIDSQLLDCVANNIQERYLCNTSGNAVKARKRSSISEKKWDEDLHITIEADVLYVLFHSSWKEEQEFVLSRITECLEGSGGITFEEI